MSPRTKQTCHKSLENEGWPSTLCLLVYTWHHSAAFSQQSFGIRNISQKLCHLALWEGGKPAQQSAKPIQLNPLQHHIVTFDSSDLIKQISTGHSVCQQGVVITMYSQSETSCSTHSPIGCQMALQGIDNDIDLSCAGFPDAAPSGILACPLAGVSL